MNREDQAVYSAMQDIKKSIPECHQCGHFKEDKGSVYWHDCTANNCRVAAHGTACFRFIEKGGEQ